MNHSLGYFVFKMIRMDLFLSREKLFITYLKHCVNNV